MNTKTRQRNPKQNDPTKTARIELRSTEPQKELLERAAALGGESLTSFILSSAIERAWETIRSATVTELSLRDMDRFREILEVDIEPNDALKAAAAAYREVVSSDV